MSLITRCPACGTMFKVVTDQLKVSRGWVRCGRCAHVFDAPLNLQPAGTLPSASSTESPAPSQLTAAEGQAEAGTERSQVESEAVAANSANTDEGLLVAAAAISDRDSALRQDKLSAESTTKPVSTPTPTPRIAPRWITGQSSAAAAPAVPAAADEASADNGPDSAEDFDPAAWREAQQRRHQEQSGFGHSLPQPLGVTKPASLDTSAGQLAAARERAGSLSSYSSADSFVDSSVDSEMPAQAEPQAPLSSPVRTEKINETFVRYDFDDSDQSGPSPLKEISFVREARRSAFWSRPRVRAGLFVLSGVLVVVLALQWAMQRRDDLAMLNPGAAPMLRSACAVMGCEIRPPRHIDAVVIDSSTFNRIGVDAYRLTFIIKNTGNLPVEVPAVEVTLTDPQDQALIRRVVIPAQFGVGKSTVPARSDVSGALSMKVTPDAGRPATDSGASPISLPVAGYRLVAFYP